MRPLPRLYFDAFALCRNYRALVEFSPYLNLMKIHLTPLIPLSEFGEGEAERSEAGGEVNPSPLTSC